MPCGPLAVRCPGAEPRYHGHGVGQRQVCGIRSESEVPRAAARPLPLHGTISDSGIPAAASPQQASLVAGIVGWGATSPSPIR